MPARTTSELLAAEASVMPSFEGLGFTVVTSSASLGFSPKISIASGRSDPYFGSTRRYYVQGERLSGSDARPYFFQALLGKGCLHEREHAPFLETDVGFEALPDLA